MLSNKLTFSLASLIVLLMIGLCLPVECTDHTSRQRVVRIACAT